MNSPPQPRQTSTAAPASADGKPSLDREQCAALGGWMFEQSDDGLLVFDPADLRVLSANSRASEITGIAEAELLGITVAELIRGADGDQLERTVRACQSDRPSIPERQTDSPERPEPIHRDAEPIHRDAEPFRRDAVQFRRDGGVNAAELSISHFGAPTERLGLLKLRPWTMTSETDVQPGDAIEAAQSADSFPIGIVIADARKDDMPIIYCNAAFEKMTGYAAEEVIGRNCRFLQSGDRDQPGLHAIKTALQDQCECSTVVRNYRKDGEMFWCEISISPVPDRDGNVTHFVGIQSDITSRKVAEAQLERSQRALEDAQRRACLGSWRYFDDTRETLWSREMYRLYHRDPKLGAPKTVEDFVQLLHPDDREAVIRRHEKVWKTRDAIENLDFRTNPKLGPMRWLDSSLTRIPDATFADGFYVAGTVMDITDRKSAELALQDSERRFRTLCQHSAMGIFLTDVDGACRYLNESGCEISGLTQHQAFGSGWAASLHPLDRDRIHGLWNEAVASGESFDAECRFLHPDGKVVWAHVRSSVRLDDTGKTAGFVGSFVDITSGKLVLAELEQSEHRYRLLVEHAPEAIVVLDASTGKFIDANENALRLFRISSEQLLECGPADFCPPFQPDGRSSLEAADTYVKNALDGGHPVYEWVHRDSQGNDIPCEVRLLRLGDASRVLVRGSITNISDRKKAEQQLRMTRFAVESTNDAMFVLDRNGKFVDVNAIACTRLGYSREELLRLAIVDLNPNYSMESHPEHWDEIKRSGRLVFESRHTRRDGTSFPVEISQSYFEFDGSEYAFAFARDISERKAVESQLRSTQLAVDQNRGLIVQVNANGQFIYANDASCEHLEYSRDELLNMSVWDVDLNWSPESWPTLWREIQKNVSLTSETVHRTKSGTLRQVEVTTNYFDIKGDAFVFAYAVDITERKETEERLRERETQLAHVTRLSTMGEMVAGIAHELNQPLYSIVNYSKATRNVIDGSAPVDTDQIAQWNDQIGKSAERAGHIIRRLRGFVQREATHSPTDLHDAIRDSLELIRHESDRARVRLDVDLDDSSSIVRIDRVQTQQVLVNLVINAIEAMEQHNSAVREVKVTSVRRQNEVMISVSDTGPGLSNEDDRSMFAAFETTKKGGMGMGLAISNTIVEAVGGRLWATPNGCGGATFHFTLPLEVTEGTDV